MPITENKKILSKVLGFNSRLDTIQVAILNIKLKHLDKYIKARNEMASFYENAFAQIEKLQVQERQKNITHIFHQNTLRVKNVKRNELQQFLTEKGIPSMIYYPLPLYKQEACQQFVTSNFILDTTELLCNEVLSLPIHTEINLGDMELICSMVKSFY